MAPKVKFSGSGQFTDELSSLVRSHLARPRRSLRARLALLAKAPIAWTLTAGSWALLMTRPSLQVIGLCLIGLMAGSTLNAFCVQHDANHGATFLSSRLNHLLAWWSSDILLGFSSYVWRVKHNVAHHTYPNVDGYDDDIGQGPLLKFAPSQEARPWYRYQHYYVWLLYCLMGIRWQAGGDYFALRRGQIGESPLRRPKRWDRLGIALGKLGFIAWALAAPLAVYPWWGVLGCYFLVVGSLGLVMATTFQLAHCVEDVAFPTANELTAEKVKPEWAAHQLATTADFCPRNRLLTWWLGGLNFQVVHHLFPKEPHTLYPTLSKIVHEVAARHGLRYTVHGSLFSAFRSHFRHVREMGRQGYAVEVEMG